MSHSSTPAKLHSASHGHHDVASEVRRYLIIFGALTVGTIVTVLASYINFGSPTMNIVVALSIASIKAFLVAGYFMHLISEKKMIYAILVATTFFFAALIYLTLWSMQPASFIHHQNYVS